MENIELKVDGKKLILTVDLTKEIGASSSGKNTLIASTEGNANVPGVEGVRWGSNESAATSTPWVSRGRTAGVESCDEAIGHAALQYEGTQVFRSIAREMVL